MRSLAVIAVLLAVILASCAQGDNNEPGDSMAATQIEQLLSLVPYSPARLLKQPKEVRETVTIKSSFLLTEEVAQLDSVNDITVGDERNASSNASVSVACLKAVKQLLKAENKYKLDSMLDALGKPRAGILKGATKWWGSFDECQAVDGAHYCLLEALVPVKLPSQLSKPIPESLSIGLCMPKECTESDINLIVKNELEETMPRLIPTLSQYIDVKNSTFETHCARKSKFTVGSSIALAICIILGLLVLAGSAIDWVISADLVPAFTSLAEPQRVGSVNTTSNLDPSINTAPPRSQIRTDSKGSEVTPLLHKRQTSQQNAVSSKSAVQHVRAAVHPELNNPRLPRFLKVLFCFSIFRNTRRLLDTTVPPGAITCIHGIRVLSISWVVLGHTYLFVLDLIDNGLILQPLVGRFTFQVISNAFFSVDSFFFIGGVLVMYLAIKQMDASGGRLPLAKFYFHRFWRLTPSYMFVVMILATLFVFFGHGPVWFKMQMNSNCRDYWWTNLLYINNFYPDMGKGCLGWGWYLACDMQFYVVSPIIIISMHRLHRKGLLVILGFLTATFITTAVITGYYKMRLGTILTTNPAAHTEDYFEKIYIKPWSRCAPYITGLALGYMLRRKDEFSLAYMYLTKWVKKPVLLLFGWCITTICLMSTLYGLYSAAHNDTVLNKAASISYSTFARFAWSVGLAWIVFTCHHGYGGMINQILSAKFWIPLSRMTYNVYLVHIPVMNIFYYNSLQPFHYNDITMVFIFFSALFGSFLGAYVTTIAVEMPFFEMEKIFFNRNANH